MELTQLYQFKIIAESGNMTKAAQTLFVSQPALSQNLSKLEKELGIRLFERKKGRLELNEYGQMALEHVNYIFDEVNKLKSISFQSHSNINHLRLASSEDPSLRYFGATITGSFPSYSLETAIIDDSDVFNCLLQDQADIVFTDKPVKHNQIFTTYICETKTFISVPCTHPFYNYQSLSWEDLNNQTFLMPNGLSYLFNKISLIEKEKNLHINKVVQRDFALYRTMTSSTPYLIFLSNLNHIYPEDRTRKIIPLDTNDLYVKYYASCTERKLTRLLPFITCIQHFYWSFETFDSLFANIDEY